MNNKQIEKLMKCAFSNCRIFILIGAIFSLQHWPNGRLILWIGFMSNFILSSFEINRLKRIVKTIEKETPTID